MDSQRNNQTWQEFQNVLPLRNRLTEDIPLKEESVFWDGIQIHCDVYLPLYFKGTLICFHGLAGNARLLSFLAVPFCRLGYRVICPDLPYYGQSQSTRRMDYEDWVQCAKVVIDHYAMENTFVFGLSMGGMLVYQAADLCTGVQGIITTCLANLNDADCREEILLESMMDRWFLAERLPKLLMHKKVALSSVISLQGLCNNPAVIELLKKDRHSAGAKVSLAFLRGLFHPNIPKPEQYTIPVLLVHPQNDVWLDVSYSQRFFERIASKKRMVRIEGAGHLPVEAIGLSQLQLEILKFIKELSL